MREFRDIYPEEREFTDSTAAARVNGYLGGSGRLSSLKEELDSLGLSEEGSKFLASRVSRNPGVMV
ncbi:hypothetical protein ACFLU6_07680 [Acidobacteriota bacterium]